MASGKFLSNAQTNRQQVPEGNSNISFITMFESANSSLRIMYKKKLNIGDSIQSHSTLRLISTGINISFLDLSSFFGMPQRGA